MIGDFQYVSSSSEADSNSDCESDYGESDGGMSKLYDERTELDKKIKAYEEKLGTIQKILKKLNSERKTLLEKRNQLIASVSGEEEVGSGEPFETSATGEIGESGSSAINQNPFGINTNSEPLNLNVPQTMNCEDDEEFDSDEDLWYGVV